MFDNLSSQESSNVMLSTQSSVNKYVDELDYAIKEEIPIKLKIINATKIKKQAFINTLMSAYNPNIAEKN